MLWSANTTYVAEPLVIANERACSNAFIRLLMADFRPEDFEREVTAGITATSMMDMIPITTISSSSVNAPGRRGIDGEVREVTAEAAGEGDRADRW